MEIDEDEEDEGKPRKVTSLYFTKLWRQMRDQREADLAHPASGNPVPVTKLLIRVESYD